MKLQQLDKERILKKVEEMRNYLSELTDILPGTEEEYVHDLVKKRACEKTVELVIECVIDICSLIVSSLKLGIPEDEENILVLLEKNNILSKSLKDTVSNMKGFRNILVHKYGKIEEELVYEFLTNNLDDFEKFVKEIKKILK